MDLKKFGEQLRALRKKAGFTQEQFIDQLQQIAAAGPADEYRVINASLVSRWESAHEHHGRFWKPTRQYVIYLAHLDRAPPEVVGGNPLALKLVVGQTAFLPLSQVLDNLKAVGAKASPICIPSSIGKPGTCWTPPVNRPSW